MEMVNIHASCVRLASGGGVLLIGPSASGKSDLALRLVDEGAVLIADDRTELRAQNGQLIAGAPQALAGLIEVRGVGILTLEHGKTAAVTLAVELVPRSEVVRMPERAVFSQFGVSIRLVRLNGFDASTPAKIRAIA